MLGRILLIWLFATSAAMAQSYPSPTYNNITVNGNYYTPSKTGYFYGNGAGAATFSTTIPGTSVPFTQSGSGAVTRTTDSKNKDILSLLDFGAVCDNSTDNSVPLQNFFNAVIAQNRAGFIPGCASKYLFSSTILVTSAGFLNVFGDGKFASVLNYSGSGNAINISPASLTGGYVNFHDFGIYNVTMNSGAAGVYQTNTTLSEYKDMAFFNQFVCLSFGPNSFSSRAINIDANTCGVGGAGAGIAFASDSSANNALIRGGHISNGGGYAAYIPNGNAIGIYGLDAEGNYGGLELGGGTNGVTSISIDGGTYIENSGAGGNLAFLGSGSTAVRGVTLANSWLGASPANNWDYVTGLVIKNLTTYNYAPYITANSTASVENLITFGTGGLTWAAGTVVNPRAAKTLNASSIGNLPTSTTPQFFGLSQSAYEVLANLPIAQSGTFSGLYVTLGSAPGGSASYAFTLRVAGADTAATCTITGSATSCSDTTHSVNISSGQTWDIKSVAAGTPAAQTAIVGVGFIN